MRGLAMRGRITGGKPGWRDDLEAMGPDPREDPIPWLDAAELLLVGNAFPAPEVDEAQAIVTLDRRHSGAVRPRHCEAFRPLP